MNQVTYLIFLIAQAVCRNARSVLILHVSIHNMCIQIIESTVLLTVQQHYYNYKM